MASKGTKVLPITGLWLSFDDAVCLASVANRSEAPHFVLLFILIWMIIGCSLFGLKTAGSWILHILTLCTEVFGSLLTQSAINKQITCGHKELHCCVLGRKSHQEQTQQNISLSVQSNWPARSNRWYTPVSWVIRAVCPAVAPSAPLHHGKQTQPWCLLAPGTCLWVVCGGLGVDGGGTELQYFLFLLAQNDLGWSCQSWCCWDSVSQPVWTEKNQRKADTSLLFCSCFYFFVFQRKVVPECKNT